MEDENLIQPNSELSPRTRANIFVGRSADENKHWLYPFRDRIISIQKIDATIIAIKICLTIDELKVEFTKETMKDLGIQQIDIDTPVDSWWDAHGLPQMAHTGEMYITLLVEIDKANNSKLLDYERR